MSYFPLLIQEWYRQNCRNLPWRNTDDPYKIWLSEIILQQTRVAQGTDYYHKFIAHFPTVKDLALAEEQDVLKLWQGLGYYSRARNLHFAAQQILNDFGGKFPDNYKAIHSLKGVGDYTAAAIASFAYGLPHAVVDGNVYRVLARYYNDSTPIDTGEGKKAFKAYADMLLDKENPAQFKQAIMELGALVCKPANPDCPNCPLQETCLAYRNGNPQLFPVKSKRIKVKKRYLHYLIYKSPEETFQFMKREGKDIWKNMYQFPLLELVEEKSLKEVKKAIQEKYEVRPIRKIKTVKHILTHQHLEVTFWEVNQAILGTDILNVRLDKIEGYPVPRVIDKFLKEELGLIL